MGKGATPAAGGPWTCRRIKGLSCAPAGCYHLFQGPVHVPGGDTHACTHTLPPSLHSVPSKHLRSPMNTDKTKHMATRMDTNSPSYLQTVPVGSHDHTSTCPFSCTCTQVSPNAHRNTPAHTCSSVTPGTPDSASNPRRDPRAKEPQGADVQGATEPLGPVTAENLTPLTAA